MKRLILTELNEKTDITFIADQSRNYNNEIFIFEPS
jgi:hypothetical protein